ncbi:cytoplasmic polyadenylation element-binding protein 1-like [Trichomycterus rosablanca]|uniref:cytoplasmic polyadenylation element-binding protein 1-like n=1 Tax=Trichomycterus rosablanca TaxID=2290929 RepID=UPI002F354A9A
MQAAKKGHVTPVNLENEGFQMKPVKKEESDDDCYFCEVAVIPVERLATVIQQCGGFQKKAVKNEEPADTDGLSDVSIISVEYRGPARRQRGGFQMKPEKKEEPENKDEIEIITWTGSLPPRNHIKPVYSSKVFLGGVPCDMNQAGLIATFAGFGPLTVTWPASKGPLKPRGYVYLVFESEDSVRALLQACTQSQSSESNMEYYFKMSSKRYSSKRVQVRPWVMADCTHVSEDFRLRRSFSAYVGALHGGLCAKDLSMIINDLFGGVSYAELDTDNHEYPTGSGRVMFNNKSSYMRAVSAESVEIRTPKFNKKIQIDPYLEEKICQVCSHHLGALFCRNQACFTYYCRSCWQKKHTEESLMDHLPLMRNQRNKDSS